jgi:hypothetical protein
MLELRCPQIESSEYLCDRVGEYQVDGTIYCARHARRLMAKKELIETPNKA